MRAISLGAALLLAACQPHTPAPKALPRELVDAPGAGSALLRQLESLEYPFCGVMFHEAFENERGYVTPDGCSVYYNPGVDGAVRFGELLREAHEIRTRNITADPERYGHPRR